MNKIIYVLLGLILIVPLFGEENVFKEDNILSKSRKFFIIKFTPGLLYGASIGYGKQHIINDTRVESICNLHYNEGTIIEEMKVGGIYLQRNAYLKKNRNGLYGILNCGIDYAIVENSTKEKNEGFVPNISFGTGYSLPVSSKSFLRIELDIGYKLYFTNLNFAIIF